MDADMGLYDSATGQSLEAVSVVEFGRDAASERLCVAYTVAERGIIAQIRAGSLRVHYFIAEGMIDADASRIGRWLDMDGQEAVRLIRERAPAKTE